MDVHWRGIIAPVNKPDAAGRKIPRKNDPNARPLPLPFRYQPADWGGHAGAIQVGLIDRVWLEGDKLWGEGRFDLADSDAADVARKVKMGFVRHMSADIEPGTNRLLGATIVDIPAFEEAEIKEVFVPDLVAFSGSPDQHGDLVPFAFRVVGDLDLPLLDDRGHKWDGAGAVGRVADWATRDGDLDPELFRRAFFYQDENSDPTLLGSYKLPYADIVDGDLVAIPRGLFSVAGGHGVDVADIPESDKETIKRRVTQWYRRMADEFDDPSIVSPWESGEMAEVEVDEVCPDDEDSDVIIEYAPVSYAAQAAAAQARAAVAVWDTVGVL